MILHCRPGSSKGIDASALAHRAAQCILQFLADEFVLKSVISAMIVLPVSRKRKCES